MVVDDFDIVDRQVRLAGSSGSCHGCFFKMFRRGSGRAESPGRSWPWRASGAALQGIACGPLWRRGRLAYSYFMQTGVMFFSEAYLSEDSSSSLRVRALSPTIQ